MPVPSDSSLSSDPGLVFVGHRVFDGLSIAAVAEVQNIFAAEGRSEEHVAVGPSRVSIYTLESLGTARSRWTSADIGTVVTEFLPQLNADPSASIVPYAAHPRLDQLRGEGSLGRVFAPSSTLKRHIDNKNTGKLLFEQLGLPHVDFVSGPPEALVVRRAAEELGYPLVARAPISSTGTGTFLIPEAEYIDAFILTARRLAGQDDLPWIFETFVDGLAVNVTAVAYAEATISYVPSVQIIGNPTCTDLPFGFCGSDYVAGSALPREARRSLRSQVESLGQALSGYGFRGLFGADFIIARSGEVLPCEINPRMQNSTALLNFSFSSAPGNSPARRHIESFSETVPADWSVGSVGTPAEDSLYAQVVLYSRSGLRPTLPEKEGVYKFDGERLEFVMPAVHPLSLTADHLLLASRAREPSDAGEGSSVARLILKSSVLEVGKSSLTPAVQVLLDQLYTSDRIPVAREEG